MLKCFVEKLEISDFFLEISTKMICIFCIAVIILDFG